MRITRLQAHDLRFPMPGGVADSVHTDPKFSTAATVLGTDDGLEGAGISMTLGRGNELVVAAIRSFEPIILGTEVDEAVASLGATTSRWSNESQLRWVGPHKGVIHLALASITIALVDLWAKAEAKPLWRLLLDMSPEEVVSLVDFHPISDYVTSDEAIAMLEERRLPKSDVEHLVTRGYPAYNTAVGWLGHSVDDMVDMVKSAVSDGYRAVKIKVGSPQLATDVNRLTAVREAIGEDIDLMIDANQVWNVEEAIEAGKELSACEPFWFEEPVHPDDALGYRKVAEALAPMRIAGGEHLSNPVLFKNFIVGDSLQVVQPDAVRLAGVSEYLAVAFMAAKAGLPAVPHVGDVGQVHQHLITFTRVALGMPLWPLEMIPHLADHFLQPCVVEGGHYRLPDLPGASTELSPEAFARYGFSPNDS